DTGAFDEDRYWIVEVDYAKADPTDLLMMVRVTNAGPQEAALHVLPTAWFRNTWSWEEDAPRPLLRGRESGTVAIDHPFLRDLDLLAGAGPDGVAPTPLFCENQTNTQRLYGEPGSTPYPKDGINEHVVHGAATVNPDRHGTKAALWYRLEGGAAGTVGVGGGPAARGGAASRRRARRGAGGTPPSGREALGADFDRVVAQRRQEADAFYAELTPSDVPADQATVMRQAFGGILLSQPLYATH